VRRGDTIERIAREQYGDNWRAGQAAIMSANGLRTNAEGSPLIREGQSLALPDLAPVSEDQLRGLNRLGGRITANNNAGLENARIEREAAANQSETARFANRSISTAGSEAVAPQGMSPDEAYRVYMNYGGRTTSDPAVQGANAAGPAAIDYGNAAVAMDGAVSSGDSGEFMNRLRNAPLGVAETLYSGLHNSAVRIAGGAASLPFAIYDGVEAAVTGRAGSLSEALEVAANTGVGVQEGFRERYGYRTTSEGAADIARTLQPVGEAIHGVVQGARNQSEALIGDGATTVLFGTMQAGLEIVGTVAGVRGAAALVEGRLPALARDEVVRPAGSMANDATPTTLSYAHRDFEHGNATTRADGEVLSPAVPRTSLVEMASGGDRLLTTMGPARLNNPLEYRTIMSELDAQGVVVTARQGEYAYGPSAMPGRPGNVVVDPDASLSALRHEYGHFLDDQALGFPGMRFYMENPSARLSSERSQYLGEIRTARQLADQTARRDLIIDYLRERNVLIETWYTRPYGQQ
jgi:phage tail protein X